MNEEQILDDLHGRSGHPPMTYDQVAAKHHTSRGTVWAIATKHEALRNQALRAQRRDEERRQQLENKKVLVNSVQTGNVVDVLRGMPADWIDLTATSIPYNVGIEYGESQTIDRQPFVEFLGFTLQALAQVHRTLKPGGTLFLQLGTTRKDDGARVPLDVLLFPYLELYLGMTFKDRIVWTKPHGLTPRDHLADRYETALVFSKGPQATFHPDAARTPQQDPAKRAHRGPNAGELSGSPLGAWPTTVWPISPVKHGCSEKTGHPAQFPEELIRRAVGLYSRPGDLVCDPFMGSGTTAAVCKQMGRSYTGCDLHYEDMRAKRLAAIEPDLASILPGVTAESIAVWQAEAHPVYNPVQRTLFEGVTTEA